MAQAEEVHTKSTNQNNTIATDLVASTDTGGRKTKGIQLKLILFVAFAWAVFQIWIASPFPYLMDSDLLRWNGNQTRSIHLSFALFLAYLSFPFSKRSPKHYIPVSDSVLAIIAALAALYYVIEYHAIADRVGAPILSDIIVACVGVPLLLEAARRCLGITLSIVASIFLVYTFFGNYMPEIIEHKGYNLAEVVNHQWITTEGVFGVALGVSTDFVFLFVLFGALLDKAGAGNYFIKLAFSCLGHLRGGPAKAAVVASGMTGLISGSSIANVVTTGTFTVPMMKKVGFSAEKAGAIEVASSVNGQIMPPVMGAAAFLMVEYVGISYTQVITHAFLPAVISYIALVYIVHLEALKSNMKGLTKAPSSLSGLQKISNFLLGFILTCAIATVCYFSLSWIKPLLGDNAFYVISAALVLAYILAIKYSAKFPEILKDDPEDTNIVLPKAGPIFKAGIYYLIPVVVLIWSLMVERLSPGLSAFWASMFTIFIIITRPFLDAYFRGKEVVGTLKQGGLDLTDGMISGSRNMIGIAIATATAGIIVGVVSQTSVGAVLADVVELLSFGNIALMLVLVAFLCMILGMGLPTTANYIVVSSLMASVIIDVGAANGLIVPLIAVHLFVFYFGLMADITPPVGLASFAAAAVSGGDPIKTGLIAFRYALRTAVLPFLFIYNTDLLLIDVTWYEGVFTFIIATCAILIFTAATQGYFLQRNTWYETAFLLIAAFSIFRADIWIDQFSDKYTRVNATEYAERLQNLPAVTPLRIYVEGETVLGDKRDFVTVLTLREGEDINAKIKNTGLNLYLADGLVEVDSVDVGSDASAAGLEAFQIIKSFDLLNNQPSRIFVYLPVFVLVFGIAILQIKRRKRVLLSYKHS
jgi:TRAP transporter 4TM/12TM fusion protein